MFSTVRQMTTILIILLDLFPTQKQNKLLIYKDIYENVSE